MSKETEIVNYTASEGITFKFIPTYSPYFGGLWKARIKYHSKRVVHTKNLIMYISRFISNLNSDRADLLPLTSAHFLIGRPFVSTVTEERTTCTKSMIDRYKLLEQMSGEHFGGTGQLQLQKWVKWPCHWRKTKIFNPILVLNKGDHTPPPTLDIGPGQSHRGPQGARRLRKSGWHLHIHLIRFNKS